MTDIFFWNEKNKRRAGPHQNYSDCRFWETYFDNHSCADAMPLNVLRGATIQEVLHVGWCAFVDFGLFDHLESVFCGLCWSWIILNYLNLDLKGPSSCIAYKDSKDESRVVTFSGYFLSDWIQLFARLSFGFPRCGEQFHQKVDTITVWFCEFKCCKPKNDSQLLSNYCLMIFYLKRISAHWGHWGPSTWRPAVHRRTAGRAARHCDDVTLGLNKSASWKMFLEGCTNHKVAQPVEAKNANQS